MIDTNTTIGKAKDLGCDPLGGKWVSICHKHGTIMNFRLKRDAIKARYTCWDGCETCVEDNSLIIYGVKK